jgi:long-chain acyl-CoA synthetase
MLHTELIAPVPELLERHAAARPEKVAYWDTTRSVTYRQLAQRTAAVATSLTKMGVREGDKIALLLPNGVDWIEACFACLRAGALVVPISHDAAEGEIAYRLEDASCRAIFTSASRKDLVEKLSTDSSRSAIMVIAGEGAEPANITLQRLASDASGDPLNFSDINRASFILYTSGTTGRAKGVLLSVRGMLWIAAACWAPICGLSERDVVLSSLPLFHSYALNLSVLSVLATGASEHIMTKFSPQQALEQVLGISWCADHVPLHHAAGSGTGHREARQGAPIHFRPVPSCRRRSIVRLKRGSGYPYSTATASPKLPPW